MNYLEAMRASNNNTRSIRGMNYLRTALQNETIIDKGLLLTTLIRLGAVIGGEWVEKAGINGAAVNPDDVVAYFGGSLDDAIAALASIIFRMDGSGHLAKGNISWNALGELLTRGKFESNINGNRIIIDPDTRDIKLINTDGKVLGQWIFGGDGSQLNLGSIDLDGYLASYTPTGFFLFEESEDGIKKFNGKFYDKQFSLGYEQVSFPNDLISGVRMRINNSNNLIMTLKNLPTNSSYPVGTVWNDNGVLKIVQ